MEAGSQAEIASNLKRIWNIRKKEMKVTQALAATQLNWTQGALSQYLNGITAMSSQTIIKLANYLDVHPTEIDPNIDKSLPSLATKDVRYSTNDPNLVLDESIVWPEESCKFFIRVDKEYLIEVDDGAGRPWQAFKGMLFKCIDVLNDISYKQTRMSTNKPFYLVQKIGTDEFVIFSEGSAPPNDKLAKKFLILDLSVF
jgi:transcriptional regulator with XRE-family HTH domain